jgi:hypothetical protein
MERFGAWSVVRCGADAEDGVQARLGYDPSAQRIIWLLAMRYKSKAHPFDGLLVCIMIERMYFQQKSGIAYMTFCRFRQGFRHVNLSLLRETFDYPILSNKTPSFCSLESRA